MHRFQRFWWVKLELLSFDFNDLRNRWNRCDISMNITRIKNLKPVLKSTQKTELKSGEVEPNRVSAWFYTNFWNFSCRKFLEVSRFRWNRCSFSMNITRIIILLNEFRLRWLSSNLEVFDISKSYSVFSIIQSYQAQFSK